MYYIHFEQQQQQKAVAFIMWISSDQFKVKCTYNMEAAICRPTRVEARPDLNIANGRRVIQFRL